MIYFDSRWKGDFGIGCFARNLEEHLQFKRLPISGSPSSPIDPIRMLIVMLCRIPNRSIVFSPGYNAPPFLVRPYVFCIMDLNHIDRPENTSFLKRLYYKLIIRRGARHAYRVITISEFSRRRIIEWAGLRPNDVINVGCGVDSRFNPSSSQYQPGYQYLLAVSNTKAHKNQQRIIQAFSLADIDRSIRLIFTGGMSKDMLKIIDTCGVKNRVEYLGCVPDEDMPSLYRGAIGMIFPSLYEGFGLPIIESMASGTPVLTSNTTSLPEISGNAALLVNPLSIEEIKNGITRLCMDPELRQSLIERGLVQASRYRWIDVAAKVREVLTELGQKA